MQFIDLSKQYQLLKADIDSRMAAVLAHGKYVLGPEVAELEAQLAAYAGVRHAISCANGTDAIQLALMASGIGHGDAVFLPTFTFSATAEPVVLAGAVPVFVDIDEASFNMCPESLAAAIAAVQSEGKLNPKAVIAVDLFGVPADYPAIEALCTTHGLTLIEDAAQSFGAALGAKRCASFGEIATTSFFPAKPLGCYGDGGCVFTDSDEIADHLQSLRVHGKGSHKYENLRVGINSRLDTLQAAVLLGKMKVFDEELVARERVRTRYDSLLTDSFDLQVVNEGTTTAVAQYALMPKAGSRDDYLDALSAAGIPSAIYYPVPLHQAPAYQGNTQTPVAYPVAESAAAKVFSVPMHPYLSDDEMGQIASVLQAAVPA